MNIRRLIFGIIILFVLSALVLIGYLRTQRAQKAPGVIEVPEETKPTPIIFEKIEQPTPTTPTSTVSLEEAPTTTSPYPTLFQQNFLYLELDYPLLYVYDPSLKTIKYLNLEDETYKEIYKVSELERAVFSPDKTKILLKEKTGFSLLDLKIDKKFILSPLVKNFIFTEKDLIIYLNDRKSISYLAYFRNGNIIKIRNLGILNPEFAFLKNNLLIYENNSPVFLLDLSKPDNLSLFLDKKENYSLLINKNQDLIYLSFKENNQWQSKIIDFKKQEKVSFSWGTIKEKCSFDDFLVCAVPINLSNFNKEDWSLYMPYYDEKIVVYNPKNNEIKEFNLEKPFDIVKPKLTPLGIIFWNRLDAKFYLIKPEEASF